MRNAYFLNIFASFGKKSSVIFRASSAVNPARTYVVRICIFHIKNNFIIVIVMTAHDKVSEGKLYSLVGKRGTRSVSKRTQRVGGEIAARNRSVKKGNERKNLGREGRSVLS